MALARFALVIGFCGAVGACSSESIERGHASGGASGTGGSGGSGGSTAVPVPDYTQSACYGQQTTTLVYDLDTHMVHPVTATCRAEGDHARMYVADELWQTQVDADAPVLGQDEVDAFMYRYELDGAAASAHPELGVLPTDELVFGNIVDASLTDGKLPVFVVNSSGAGDGYLCSWCDKPALHLDGPTLRSLHADKTLSIAAHESFHAIHHGYDPDEEVWVDETIAEAAMTVNGFYTDQAWVSEFMHKTNQAWGPGIDDAHAFDYGAGLLFGTYLWEHGGAPLLYAITHELGNGWDGIDAALGSVGDPSTGWQLFGDMALSMFFQDPTTGYGFKSFSLDGSVLTYAAQTGTALSDTIQPCGLMFVTFDAGAASVELDTTAAVTARLVLDGDPLDMRDLAANQRTSFGGKTPRVLLLTAQQAAKISVLAR